MNKNLVVCFLLLSAVSCVNYSYTPDVVSRSDHTKNKTVIKTVSIAQARKPIYKSSVNLSDEYKKYLNFLNEL